MPVGKEYAYRGHHVRGAGTFWYVYAQERGHPLEICASEDDARSAIDVRVRLSELLARKDDDRDVLGA